ncbi:MAG: hypothetical protein GSR85_08045 [Desulfurococcales archaeon]|nr:hypothetical protein [Desulfurococcales archaeon]
MPLTTFEEEIYLRALTGRLVGKAMADLGVNKLAVVSPKNIICSSIASATEAVFIEASGGVTRHFMVEIDSNEDEVARRIAEFGPQVTLLQYGGETPMEDNKRSFTNLLKQMARRNVAGDIVVHVRIFAAKGLDEALKDPEVREYLRARNLYTYTVGFDEGKIYVNRIHVNEDGTYTLQWIREYQVTLEHADLLNRSIRGRRLVFQEAKEEIA